MRRCIAFVSLSDGWLCDERWVWTKCSSTLHTTERRERKTESSLYHCISDHHFNLFLVLISIFIFIESQSICHAWQIISGIFCFLDFSAIFSATSSSSLVCLPSSSSAVDCFFFFSFHLIFITIFFQFWVCRLCPKAMYCFMFCVFICRNNSSANVSRLSRASTL